MPTTEELLLRTTDAPCGDAPRGQMLMPYLDDELSTLQKADFEEHVRRCEHCNASVYNWRTIIAYMRANLQMRFSKHD